MTPKGYDKLREELRDLRSQRPAIADAIEEARGHGDLSENGDYDAAKNKSGMVEAKIKDIEIKLTQANVIDPLKINLTGSVVFGSTVDIEDLDSGELKKFSIYGPEDTDVKNGLISYETPIAKALIGKKEGDVVIIRLPAGNKEFEILKIYIDYK